MEMLIIDTPDALELSISVSDTNGNTVQLLDPPLHIERTEYYDSADFMNYLNSQLQYRSSPQFHTTYLGLGFGVMLEHPVHVVISFSLADNNDIDAKLLVASDLSCVNHQLVNRSLTVGFSGSLAEYFNMSSNEIELDTHGKTIVIETVGYNGLVSGPIQDEGPQGPTGEQGDKGNIGDVGPIGPTLAGSIGEQGRRGIRGPRGETGTIGEVGPIGEQGPKGKTGKVGKQGKRGSRGEQGPQGPQGLTGYSGKPGPRGPQGIQGPQGPTGDCLPGDTGDVGSQGPQGEQGDKGPQGLQGPIGYRGISGPTTYAEKIYFAVMSIIAVILVLAILVRLAM